MVRNQPPKAKWNGSGVLGRIDHSGVAASANLELRPNTVITFGNVKLGPPLMQSNPPIGLEFLLRVPVYRGKAFHIGAHHGN